MKFSKSIQRLVDRANRALGLKPRHAAAPRPKRAPARRSEKPSPAVRKELRRALKHATPADLKRWERNARSDVRRIEGRKGLAKRTKPATKRSSPKAKTVQETVHGKRPIFLIHRWESIGGGRYARYVSNENGSTEGKAIIDPPRSRDNASADFVWSAEHEYDGIIAQGSAKTAELARQQADAALTSRFKVGK